MSISAADNSVRDEGMFGLSDLLQSLPDLRILTLVLRKYLFYYVVRK